MIDNIVQHSQPVAAHEPYTKPSIFSWTPDYTHIFIFVLVWVLVGGNLLLQGNIGLNLADEGYLWYGSIRTAAGDVPTLDFDSYDPGRYYWTAAWLKIFGQSIIGLRLAVALFQFLGLWLGLLAVQRVFQSWWILSLVGLLLISWMYPRHKLFEHSLALIGIYIAVRLIEKPVSRNYLLAGMVVGLASYLGRNHGLFHFSGFLTLILLLAFKQKHPGLFRRLGFWGIGIVIGYIPMLLMFFFIPGMFTNYLDKILRSDAANPSLAVPWFWSVNYNGLAFWDAASAFFVGLLFFLIPVFYFDVFIWFVFRKGNLQPRFSLIIASACIGVFYMYQSFLRADVSHLAQGIPAFLVMIVALIDLLRSHNRRGLAILTAVFLLAITLLGILPYQPVIRRQRHPEQFTRYEITGSQLWIDLSTAVFIRTITQFVNENLEPDEAIFIAPHFPGIYPILHRQSPTYDIYIVLPESEAHQKKVIADLEKHRVNWALIDIRAVDDREEWAFPHLYPLVWDYLLKEFTFTELSGLSGTKQLYYRRVPFPID